MPRKKKEEENTDESVSDVTQIVTELVPIAELLKQETTILGENHGGKLPRNAEFSPVFLEMATRLVAAGFSENDLAYIIGCSLARIKYWKRHNPLFKKACTEGKYMAKGYLVAQGLRAAAGYNMVEKNIKIKRKVLEDGSVVEYAAEESHFHKHVKPDSTLLMFMLANISRQLGDETPWTSQHKIEVDDKKTLNIKISGKIATDQINRLAGAFLEEDIIEAEVVSEENSHNAQESRRLSGGNTSTSDE